MKKSIYILMASALIAAAGMTACSGKPAETAASGAAASESTLESTASNDPTDASQQPTDTEETENTQAADTEDTENETLNEEEITELYRGFARSLQNIISSKNMNDLAELLVYPSYIGIDEGITVNNRDEFLALDADKVFTDALIQAVKTADIDSTKLTQAGFIVGDPSGKPAVTIGLDKEGSMGITGINY